jgi:hypothetical protein
MLSALIDGRMGRGLPVRRAILYIVILAPPMASLILTNGKAELQLASVLYGAAVLFSFAQPAFAVFAVASIMSIPLLNLGDDAVAAGIDARFLVIPFIAGLALRARWFSSASHPHGYIPKSALPLEIRASRIARLALPMTALLGLASISWSIDSSRTTSNAVALIVGAVFCASAARVVPIRQMVQVLAILGLAATAASIVLSVAAPELAVSGGRVRGIFQNSNALAIFLVVFSPLMLAQLIRFRWIGAILLAGLCIATASRAGCAAFLLELTVFALAGQKPITRLLTILSGGTVTAWLALRASQEPRATTPSLLLLRNNNSRAESWAQGIRYFESHQLLGVGAGALPPGSIGGLVPQLLATSGVVGSTVASVFLVALLVSAFRASAMYTSLVVGSLVDVVFEPWLFTAGSMFCVVFWLIICHPETLGYNASRTIGSPRLASPPRPDGSDRVTPAESVGSRHQIAQSEDRRPGSAFHLEPLRRFSANETAAPMSAICQTAIPRPGWTASSGIQKEGAGNRNGRL